MLVFIIGFVVGVIFTLVGIAAALKKLNIQIPSMPWL